MSNRSSPARTILFLGFIFVIVAFVAAVLTVPDLRRTIGFGGESPSGNPNVVDATQDIVSSPVLTGRVQPSPRLLATPDLSATQSPLLPTPTVSTQVGTDIVQERVILSEEEDIQSGWNQTPNTTTEPVFEGEIAFIPSGNNVFEKDLGVIGYEEDELRFIKFKIFLLNEQAGLLLQAYVDSNWNYRWGFDGRSTYQGAFGWERVGESLNIPTGKWVDISLDVMNDLGARPGQMLMGMAFSANDGNMIIDRVSLSSSPRLTVCIPSPVSETEEGGDESQETVILSNNEDNIYDWMGGSPYITTQGVDEGNVAFIPTGNNVMNHQLGVIGLEENEFRFIYFKICLLKQEAALLLQTRVDGSWEHRWGFDGRATYQGVYDWERRGATLEIKPGEWVDITLDFMDDLGANSGQILNGLAFSGNDGNVLYTRVSLISSR